MAKNKIIILGTAAKIHLRTTQNKAETLQKHA